MEKIHGKKSSHEIGKLKKIRKKKWITEEIPDEMENRRELKRNPTQYKEKNKEIRRL